MSRGITYTRGASSVSILATVGRTIFRVDDGFQIFQRIESRDYIVDAADLVLDGSQVLPERGDRIEETANGATYTYEVMAPGGEPHYRWSDREHNTLRIHTKLVDQT